jgi:hypothetical protein
MAERARWLDSPHRVRSNTWQEETARRPGRHPLIDIGIKAKDREKDRAEGLSRVLADTYTLYPQDHNFHWNVEGPMFNTLHLMFMDQYTELWNALDAIAERVSLRSGYPAPGTGQGVLAGSRLDRGTEGVPDAARHGAAAGGRPRSRDAHRRAPHSPPPRRPAMNPRAICSRSACRFTRRPRGCCALPAEVSA